MKSQPLKLEQIDGFAMSLYDSHENFLAGVEFENIDFTQQFYHKNNSYFYLDQSPQLHHGVKYIVIRHDTSDTNTTIQNRIITIASATILAVFFIGYFLSRIFLKPIQNQRLKLDTFIKDTTHELNTPISALLMSISSLRAKPNNEKILERIEISAKRVNKIYSDMSYLLMSDNSKNETSICDLKTIIEDELSIYEILATKKKITITQELKPLLIKIAEDDLQRVVSNLISNSIKYNKKGGGIELRIDTNRLIIKDSGIGIKTQNLSRIFERYFREDNHEGGFGIGMDIVNSVAQKYDIKMEISSEVDKGTEIRLDFSSIVADLSD